MTKTEQQRVLTLTRRAAFDFAYKAARQAGLDADTSDAVAHKFVTRAFDATPPLVGKAINAVLIDEIQKHAAP